MIERRDGRKIPTKEIMKNLSAKIKIFAFIALVLTMSQAAFGQDSTQQQSGIENRLHDLEQQILILKRQREIDQEAAAQKQQSAAASPFGQGRFTGVIYGDYFYNVSRDTSGNRGPALPNTAIPAASNAKNFNGFELRRFYLTFDDDFSDKLTIRFRFEDDQIAAAGGANTLFVKDAYITWKEIFSGSEATFGEQPTPATTVSEAAWGYRSLEKTELDLRGFVTTRDLGLSLKGRIDASGNYNYWLLIADNSNTAVETEKYKRYYLNLQGKPFENFQIAVSGDYAALAPAKTTIHDNDKSTVSVVAWYGVKETFNIGAEVFSQNAANAAAASTGSATRSDIAEGYSLFGSYNITPVLAAVLRYDSFDPNTNSNVKGDSRNLLIAALSWKADKTLFLQPNLEYETYETNPASGASPGVSYDASLTARLTLYYQF